MAITADCRPRWKLTQSHGPPIQDRCTVSSQYKELDIDRDDMAELFSGVVPSGKTAGPTSHTPSTIELGQLMVLASNPHPKTGHSLDFPARASFEKYVELHVQRKALLRQCSWMNKIIVDSYWYIMDTKLTTYIYVCIDKIGTWWKVTPEHLDTLYWRSIHTKIEKTIPIAYVRSCLRETWSSTKASKLAAGSRPKMKSESGQLGKRHFYCLQLVMLLGINHVSRICDYPTMHIYSKMRTFRLGERNQ